MEAASAPLVTMAPTAPSQTDQGQPLYWAAILAAVIWPTSPHSEKKMAANDTNAARDAGYSFFSFTSLVSGLRQSTYAMAQKLMAVRAATTGRGKKVEMALPSSTATAIFAMNATAMPKSIGVVRYRVAS